MKGFVADIEALTGCESREPATASGTPVFAQY